MAEEVGQQVLHYKKYLEKYKERPDADAKILYIFRKLEKLSISLELLAETGIGKVVSGFRKREGEIADRARQLIGKWKQLLAEAEEAEMEEARAASPSPVKPATLKCETVSETTYNGSYSSHHDDPRRIPNMEVRVKNEPSEVDLPHVKRERSDKKSSRERSHDAVIKSEPSESESEAQTVDSARDVKSEPDESQDGGSESDRSVRRSPDHRHRKKYSSHVASPTRSRHSDSDQSDAESDYAQQHDRSDRQSREHQSNTSRTHHSNHRHHSHRHSDGTSHIKKEPKEKEKIKVKKEPVDERKKSSSSRESSTSRSDHHGRHEQKKTHHSHHKDSRNQKSSASSRSHKWRHDVSEDEDSHEEGAGNELDGLSDHDNEEDIPNHRVNEGLSDAASNAAPSDEDIPPESTRRDAPRHSNEPRRHDLPDVHKQSTSSHRSDKSSKRPREESSRERSNKHSSSKGDESDRRKDSDQVDKSSHKSKHNHDSSKENRGDHKSSSEKSRSEKSSGHSKEKKPEKGASKSSRETENSEHHRNRESAKSLKHSSKHKEKQEDDKSSIASMLFAGGEEESPSDEGVVSDACDRVVIKQEKSQKEDGRSTSVHQQVPPKRQAVHDMSESEEETTQELTSHNKDRHNNLGEIAHKIKKEPDDNHKTSHSRSHSSGSGERKHRDKSSDKHCGEKSGDKQTGRDETSRHGKSHKDHDKKASSSNSSDRANKEKLEENKNRQDRHEKKSTDKHSSESRNSSENKERTSSEKIASKSSTTDRNSSERHSKDKHSSSHKHVSKNHSEERSSTNGVIDPGVRHSSHEKDSHKKPSHNSSSTTSSKSGSSAGKDRTKQMELAPAMPIKVKTEQSDERDKKKVTFPESSQKEGKRKVTNIDENNGMSFDDFLNFDNVQPKKKRKTELPSHSKSASNSHSGSSSSNKSSSSKSHEKGNSHSEKGKDRSSSKRIKKEKTETRVKREVVSEDESDSLAVPVPVDEVNLSSTDLLSLPEINPNYRPLPRIDLDRKERAEDLVDMTQVGLRSYSRNAVYAGRKATFLTAVPTLYESCIRVLTDNIDSLDYVGGVPYDILKEVFEKCTVSQLFTIEDVNPQFIGETEELWQIHAKKDFRSSKPDEDETWRELYLRKYDEREEKLKKLTANISASMVAKKAPVRSTKLAYVDAVAKAPRDVRRKQLKYGTAGTTKEFDPLAKLSSHPGQQKHIVPTPGSEPSTSRASFSGGGGSRGSSSGGGPPAGRPPKPEREVKKAKVVAPMMQKTLKFMKKLQRR